MTLNTYLYFAGNCKEALTFYEETIDGKVLFSMPFGGSPAEGMMPPGWEEKILHATIRIGNQTVLASDTPPGHSATRERFALSLEVESVAEAERVFAALTEGGQVTMAMVPTFWSPMFGMGKDRFGTPWIVGAAGEPQP